MAPRSEPYRRWARYYDSLYEGIVDYKGDVRTLDVLFRRLLGRRPGTLLDLGCGTGTHALLFARGGYEVTGLDASRSQLSVARQKAKGAQGRVRLVLGDMRSFRLPGPLDVAVSLFGGFGYLLRTRDVLSCFRSVRRHLVPDGVFAFEFWHRPGIRPPPYQSWVHHRRPGIELIRLSESRFDRRTGLLPIEFRFLVLRGKRVLDRFDETHTIRTYTVPEVRGLLRRAGLELVSTRAIDYPEKSAGRTLSRKTSRVSKKTSRVLAVARPAYGVAKR